MGLVQCASLAHFGHEVVGIDNDPNKIERLNAGECPFFEPGLESMLRKYVETGRTRQIFTAPRNEQTEAYITGRFG